ncbi:hypothetical protein EJV47_05675 [Hymenobacter gummosus]|uniref:Lipoprotein n=1 Tax=Hymenobacter gummosus TaxID=1776032 RepID=A0A3S0QKE1_9BACT|nr:hypothetical protein [Hymenobacter gummosus]RTQ52500.1 hypothetical protein EJV47_05675 [Hymenobacter gummosus]
MRYCCGLVILGVIAACRAEKPALTAPVTTEAAPPPDQDTVAILSYDKTNEYFYWDDRKARFGDATHLELTPRDLALVDSLLRQSVAAWNAYQRQHGYTGPPLNPNGYKRQLLAVVTPAGEKLVWVNWLCEASDTRWKQTVIQVSDGGDCYFNVQLNLSRRSWEEVSVNSSA